MDGHYPAELGRAFARLLDLKPARLAVGHGAVLEEPVSAMRQAVEAGERRAAG